MRRSPRSALLSVTPWAVALCAATLAPAAVAHPGACVAPSGGDDTGRLQAALDRCSGAGRTCTVHLCAGVFPTGILLVRDFRGTLRGAGSKKTVLRALPELAVSAHAPDFFREDPWSPAGHWPYLVQFVGGRARIEDLAIEIPAPPATGSDDPVRPTTGWFFFGEVIRELAGALLLTGHEGVAFDVRRVRIAAGPDPASELGTTLIAGVSFEGLLFNPDDPGPYPVHPLGGRLGLTGSVLSGMVRATSLAELREAVVILSRSHLRTLAAVSVIDADRAFLAVEGNRWEDAVRGVQVLQNLDGTPSRRSVILVRSNAGEVGAGGDGLFFQDPFDPSFEPGATALHVRGNHLALGEGATSAVTAIGAGHLSIRDNRVVGHSSTGLEVDLTNGCRVAGNSLHGLDTGGGPDLHLGPATTECLAVVSRPDVVVDEGHENRVIRK